MTQQRLIDSFADSPVDELSHCYKEVRRWTGCRHGRTELDHVDTAARRTQ